MFQSPQLLIIWEECRKVDLNNGFRIAIGEMNAAFDRALVTFTDDGTPEFSPLLSPAARNALVWEKPLTLTPLHLKNLQNHRRRFSGSMN
jgi:hypothetical protein